MKNCIFIFCVAIMGALSGIAQETTLKGRIVDAISNEPIPGVAVQIRGSIFVTETDALGIFSFAHPDLPLGEQVVVISKSEYLTKRIPVTIQENETIDLDPIFLEVDFAEVEAQIGIISLSDNDLNQEEGTAYNISGLLQAANDAFLDAAAFDFSATFFRPRGLDSENGVVLINGIEMNKSFNGRPQWSNWGGLNDVQRNRVFTMGLKANEYDFGGIAGTTNIIMRASQYREGGRVSYAAANRTYRGRVMGSYSSGMNLGGWAYTVLLSRRFGNEGFEEGTLYDANSFFASVEKKLGNAHSLNFSGLYTPNRRGRSTAITQEMKDLKGIRYNPNWGYQEGEMRNSRIREIEEPILMLNHYWKLSPKTLLNTNLAYQFGKNGQTRIDNGGTRLLIADGMETYIGGARNPFGNYYQRLPSYFLQDPNPTPIDYQKAYLAQREFVEDGQLDWHMLYEANTNATNMANGGNSIFVIQEDRTDDKQITVNSILNSQISENISLNGKVSFRNLTSENFAQLTDLLGGTGYLDVDFFAEDDVNTIVGDVAQSDLRNRNRMVREGERYKYNYDLAAHEISGFAQGQFKYSKIDFFLAASVAQSSYQRNGLYENGNFPGNRSFGQSEQLNFTNFGVKGGATYKVTGRHFIDVNAGFLTKAPTLRNSFSNVRQNNDIVIGLTDQKITSADASYIYRSPLIKARLTGFYATLKDASEIGFYFTENLAGMGLEEDAFVQEIVTGIETRHLGGELGIEAQLTPTVQVSAAASVGQYIYNNNPNLYLTSDDFEGPLIFGDGTVNLKDYHVAGGPERAYQLGFEYRDPSFWWIGLSSNYFSNAYIDVNNLARSQNFSLDFDGQPFNEYNEEVARQLLKQEKIDPYYLVNLVGGKSWKIRYYFVGFFATVNNVLDQEYKTGGFEQGRKANYRDLLEDKSRANGPIFGTRYFFGNGTTYYVNLYVRF